jgi:hypothetical protein
MPQDGCRLCSCFVLAGNCFKYCFTALFQLTKEWTRYSLCHFCNGLTIVWTSSSSIRYPLLRSFAFHFTLYSFVLSAPIHRNFRNVLVKLAGFLDRACVIQRDSQPVGKNKVLSMVCFAFLVHIRSFVHASVHSRKQLIIPTPFAHVAWFPSRLCKLKAGWLAYDMWSRLLRTMNQAKCQQSVTESKVNCRLFEVRLPC